MKKEKKEAKKNLDYFEEAKFQHDKIINSEKDSENLTEIDEKDKKTVKKTTTKTTKKKIELDSNEKDIAISDENEHEFIKVVKKLEGFEHRESQIKVVDTINEAIRENTNAFIEAGTGSGKSFAYLYPIISSGKPAVISTGTIALQEQLLDKDIPFLQKSKDLPKFKAVIAKGRSNYVCLQKFSDLENKIFQGSPLRLELNLIMREVNKGWNGDFSTLPFQVSNELKHEIESSNEDCIKFKCEFYNSQKSPFFNARKELEGADIIVTNHSLYMIDVTVGSTILPPHETVVFDEAHHIYMNAIKGFTVTIGRYSITKLLQKIQKRVTAIPDYIARQIINEESYLFEWVFKKRKHVYRIV